MNCIDMAQALVSIGNSIMIACIFIAIAWVAVTVMRD